MPRSRVAFQHGETDSVTGIVRKLITHFDGRPKEEKQAFLDDVNEHGNTGLHWAALGGHLEVVKLLLEHKATPALANEQNYVPLDLARFNEKEDVAQYFLSFAGMIEKENESEGLSAAAEGVDIGEEGDKKVSDGNRAV